LAQLCLIFNRPGLGVGATAKGLHAGVSKRTGGTHGKYLYHFNNLGFAAGTTK